MAKTPYRRYDRDVAGMPVFAATEQLLTVLAPEDKRDAVPLDDENCAVALGCKRQFRTPYVSVGRSRTDLALPHPRGVIKLGYGNTKWAVIRYGNSKSAREVIIEADTGELDEDGVIVKLLPQRESLDPDVKRQRNKRFRTPKGVKDGRGTATGPTPDELTLMGVRTLTGQRRR